MKEFVKDYGATIFILNSAVFISGMAGILDYRIALIATAVMFYRAGFVARDRVAKKYHIEEKFQEILEILRDK